MTTTEHGILFSHASLAVADDLITHQFPSAAAALVHAHLVCRASAGVQFEPMSRIGRGPWISAAGLTAPEVICERWQA